MKASLTILKGTPVGKELVLKTGNILIGRDPSCQLRMRDAAVSKAHCEFRVAVDQVSLTDRNSRNGTFVNDERITGTVQLKHGDKIRIAGLIFGLRIVTDNDTVLSAREESQAGDEINDSSVNSGIITDWLADDLVNRPPTALLIDEKQADHGSFIKVLESLCFAVESTASVFNGLNLLKTICPDVIFLSDSLCEHHGCDTLDIIRKQSLKVPVVILDGSHDSDRTIEIMKLGADDYLKKPAGTAQTREVIERLAAFRAATSVTASDITPESSPVIRVNESNLLGGSRAMQNVLQAISRLARTDTPVLITGEPGSGKEAIAKAIFRHSKRAKLPLREIRCGAADPEKIARELFGYERHAFQNAERRRIGLFEQHPEGTLILYEIEDLLPDSQLRLVEIIQDQRFCRIGGSETVAAKVRVIAVTQSNLDSLVEAGTFRQELFFQLKPFSITSPPLRDRAEDIGLLADAFVADACREFGLPAIRISAETHTVLRNRDWPANLRELRSVLREAVMRASGTVLLPTHLSTATTTISPATKSTPTGGDTELAVPAQPLNNPMPAWETYLTDRLGSGSRNLYAECLTAMERQLFEHVLRFTENDTAQAAEILGFTSSGFEQRLERIRKNSMRIM